MKRALYRSSAIYADVNSVCSKSTRDDIYHDLYLITNAKAPYFVYPEEEKISPKPGATAVPEGDLSKQKTAVLEGDLSKQKTTVPEGRRSKRKVRKPTKRLTKPSATITKASEPAQKAKCDPLIETSAGASVLSPDKKSKTVKKPKAIPKASTAKKGKAKENSRHCHPSKENYTVEMSDLLYAQYLVKADLHLRSSDKQYLEYAEVSTLCNIPPAKSEDTYTESMYQNSIMSPEIRSEVGKKQAKRDIKKPEQIPAKIRKGKQGKVDPDAGSSSDKMYVLSDSLAGIIGHQQEPEKKNIKSDAQLPKKVFRGKRHLPVADVMKRMSPHLVPV